MPPGPPVALPGGDDPALGRRGGGQRARAALGVLAGHPEVAGQLITLIAVPISWKSLLLGFILFRGFDIVKPPPLRRLEQLPEGAGIVADDVGAGLYALAVMQIVLHFGLLPR